MRVLYISYVNRNSGAWVHTRQFVKAFARLHQPFRAFCPLAQPPGDQRSSRKWLKDDGSTGPFREMRFLAATFTRRALDEWRLIREYHPDVVVLREGRYLSSIVICKLLRVPLLLEDNEPVDEERMLPSSRRLRGPEFWQWFQKRIFQLCSHIMVVSSALRNHYISLGLGTRKITAVPNGVDPQRFDPDLDTACLRERLGLEGRMVIGFSGSFSPWHGLDFLARAFGELLGSTQGDGIQLVLLLIGQAGAHYRLPRLPSDHVVQTGRIPHSDMPAYLSLIDIFVAPYPRIKPFYFSPLKIIEAMAMRKPVLASAQGQIRELVRHGRNGMLYEPGDLSGFLGHLRQLIDDSELRKALGREARRTIETGYTWQHNAGAVLKLCRSLAPLPSQVTERIA